MSDQIRKNMTAVPQRQFHQTEALSPSPCQEIGPSLMLVPAATPAGCQVNPELPNKVQKGTDIARNTVNNKLTTKLT